jgi:hypothetical protein
MTHTSTASGSSPHADSRSLTVINNPLSNGAYALMYTCDGGIFFRNNLLTDKQGDWYSMNGDLTIAEALSISFDPYSSSYVVGMQDNSANIHFGRNFEGISYQKDDDGEFDIFAGGDGGYTDVDTQDTNAAGTASRMYLGTQNFNLHGILPDGANGTIVEHFNMTGVTSPFQPFFYVNKYNKGHLLLCIRSSTVDPEGCYMLQAYSGITPPAQSKVALTHGPNTFLDRFIYGGVIEGKVDKDLVFGASSMQVMTFQSNNGTYVYSNAPWKLSTNTTRPPPFNNPKFISLFPRISAVSVNPGNAKEVLVTMSQPDGVYFSRDFGKLSDEHLKPIASITFY